MTYRYPMKPIVPRPVVSQEVRDAAEAEWDDLDAHMEDRTHRLAREDRILTVIFGTLAFAVTFAVAITILLSKV